MDLEPIYFSGFSSTSDEIEEYSDSESEKQVEKEEWELIESSPSAGEIIPHTIPESPIKPGTSGYSRQPSLPPASPRRRGRSPTPRVRSRSPRVSYRFSSPVKHHKSLDRDRDYRPRRSDSPARHRSTTPRRSPRRRLSPRKTSTECWNSRTSCTGSPD